MTREEKIRKEALNWKLADTEFIAQTAFEAGAKWADGHPNSPWVSPEVDLPELNIPVLVCVHIEYRSMTTIPKPYIIEINNRVPDFLSKRMSRELGEPYTDKYGFSNHGAVVYRVLFWAPIPELPKGGEI